MSEVTVTRSLTIREAPIDTFAQYAQEHGLLDEATVAAIRSDVEAVIADAAEFALSSPDADPAELYDALYVT